MTRPLSCLWISLFAVGAAQAPLAASASTLQVVDYFNYIDHRQDSALGPGGVFLNVGLDITPPSGTSVVARQGAVTKNIPSLNSPAAPNQFISNRFAYSAALTGAWTLTATNAGATNSPLQVTTLPICPTLCSGAYTPTHPFLVPFVTDVYTDGLSTTPHFSWAVPDYAAPANTTTGLSVNIFALGANGTYSLISAVQLASTATSYTVPGNLLVNGGKYVIGVQTNLYNVGDEAANHNTHGSAVEESRAFFSFSPSTQATSFAGPVALPVVDANGRFSFDLSIRAGVPVLLDPSVAIGYDFQVGQGDPLFASVALPNLGDFDYGLYLWDGMQWVFDTVLAPLTVFDFAAGGVDRFRIDGIPVAEALDPTNVAAFETQVTFAADGRFTGTMTPIQAASVPEPAPLTLLAIGAGGLATRYRRRRHVAPEGAAR